MMQANLAESAIVGLAVLVGAVAAPALAFAWLWWSARRSAISLERRLAETLSQAQGACREVERQNRFLDDLLEHGGSLVFVKDLDGAYQRINRHWEEVTGMAREAVLGKTDLELFPEGDGKRFRDNDLQVLRTGRAAVVEEGLGEGECRRWFLSVKFPVRDERGEASGICGMITEITERRRLERALEAREMMLREAAELAHVGGWQFDPATGEGTWTDETARIHDLEPSDRVLAADGLSFYCGESRARVETAVREAIELGTPYDLELELTSATGRRKWVRTIAHPQMEGGKVVLVRGSFQDVTERKRAAILSEGQAEVLEMISQGAGLRPTLEALVRVVERAVPDARASILLLDRETGRLYHGAAPSLPEAYSRAIDGMAIGPRAGSCGTAAYLGEEVLVQDVLTHPLWVDFRDLAREHGLRACWSAPIFDQAREVSGTFAIYLDGEARETAGCREVIEKATHTASICIARHRIATALRESESRFRLLTESLPLLVWGCGPEGNCDYLSPQWASYIGEEVDQGPPVDLALWVHPDDRDEVQRRWQASLADRSPFRAELRLRRYDGAYRWFDSICAPLLDASGQVSRWLGANTDISERKEGETKRDRLVSLIERSQDFIAMADLAGHLTYLNAGGRRMIGLADDADLGDLRFFDYVPESWQDFFRGTVLESVAEQGHWEGEMRLRHLGTGAAIDVERTIFFLREGRSGEPVCYATVTRDVTERKRNERRRAAQNAVSRVLALAPSLREATPRLLEELVRSEGWRFGALWDGHGASGMLRCNEIWHDLMPTWAEGLARQTCSLTFGLGEGLVGRVWESGEAGWVADLASDSTYTRAESAARAGLRSAFAFPVLQGGIVTAVVELLGAEVGEPDESLREAFAEAGRQIGVFMEQCRVEEQVRELNASLESRVRERTLQLEAANRELEVANRELEAFSYSVSHDLRAPLRAIDGFSLALLEDCGDGLPPEGREYLATVRAETQRMGALIDDLLAFSRLGRTPLVRQRVDFGVLVRAALETLAPERAGRRIEIEIADLAPCDGDPALLLQVWINLFSNALKYTKKCEVARIEVGCTMEDVQPVYFVRDNGAGFDMRYAHKLFRVFERLHSSEDYEGTGVGLAIVRRIVERHGGKVWAIGEPNRGATIHFTVGDAFSSAI